MRPQWVNFRTKEVVVTQSIEEHMKDDDRFNKFVYRCLSLFANCEWGDISEEDKALNDQAVRDGEGRLMGSYPYAMGDDGEHIWIITEYDRSVTTILYPYEY